MYPGEKFDETILDLWDLGTNSIDLDLCEVRITTPKGILELFWKLSTRSKIQILSTIIRLLAREIRGKSLGGRNCDSFSVMVENLEILKTGKING